MTKLTQSQIGQLRTRISWILVEAEIAKHNSGLLGRRGADEGVVMSELCTALGNIADVAKRAKKMIQGVKEKRPQACLDKEAKE